MIEKVMELYNQGVLLSDIGKILNISTGDVYKIIQKEKRNELFNKK